MKHLLILGSGTGGTMVAAKMRKKLDSSWKITIIDRSTKHHYQAGWLFIPFGVYNPKDTVRSQYDFIPPGVEFVVDEIQNVDPVSKTVKCAQGSYSYDWLVIATGCRVAPEEIEGMEEEWKKGVHSFYTPDAALALRGALRKFQKGRLVLNIAEMPIKCPVAPLEFVFMADWYFVMNGVRDQIEIDLVTPLTGAFTKPVAAANLGQLCQEKNINIVPNFEVAAVNMESKTIESHRGDEVPFDLLVAIPPNLGSQVIVESDIGDIMGYMETEPATLKSKTYENCYIIGDATNVATSKAGAVAHYESDIVAENLEREIEGLEPKPDFDGHSTCFIVTGFEKSSLIDFNYKVEPLPGKYPLPGVGPFDLLGESVTNYWGKLMFKWVYFNLMLKGKELPLEAQMFMAGKIPKSVLV